MFTTASSPDALIANRITGKMKGKTSCPGWRMTRRKARRPSTATCSSIPGRATPAAALAAGIVTRRRCSALELAAGLRQEDVVERRFVQLQLGELHAGLVERA